MHHLQEDSWKDQVGGYEIDVYEALLERSGPHIQWGVEFGGGKDYHQPIKIHRVRPGSPAHKIGLRAGDDVTEIGDTPTADLSSKQANDLILTYGLSLILTVERRARGAIPSNPVVSHPGPPAQLKSYQPYDLSGAMPTHHPHHHQVPQPQNYEIHTVSARPYDPPPGQRYHNPPPPQRTRPEPSGYSRNAYGGGDMGYDEEDGHQHQSRTFKILQSLMANEGGAAVPSEADPSKAAPNRVIRNAQFNTPMGLYNRSVAADALSDKMAGVGLQDSHGNEEEDGNRVVIKSNALELVHEMDKEGKTAPSHRGPRLRDLPRSRSRIQESFERDELNSQRIGNVSHIRHMRAQRNLAENANLPKDNTLTCSSDLPQGGSQNPAPIPVLPSELSHSQAAKFEAPVLSQDSEDLSKNSDVPSFLQKKSTVKQWRPVRPAQEASKNKDALNAHVNLPGNGSRPAAAYESSSHRSSPYGNNENYSNTTTTDQKSFSSQMKFSVNASPRLSDPYPSNTPPPPPANLNATRNPTDPQPGLVGGHSSAAAGLADERRDQGAPGTTIAPIQSDLLRAEDDIPYGTPHQSRTFRILQDMVGDEEPYSGSQGLPPPRSATREQQRPAQAQPQQDRVKVFMPQQYNTPITMYSAANIMDTFQGQAGAHIENMDEQRAASSSPISGAQQAVIEHDHGGFSEF